MSKEKEYIEINPIVLVVILLIIAGLVIFFVTRDSSDENTQTEVQGALTSVFDDPNISPVSVQIDLENSVYVGAQDEAQYAIIEFSDFQCPYCVRHSEQTLPSILKDFVDTGKALYLFNDIVMYPPESEMLSSAGLCVYEASDIDTYMEFRKVAYGLDVENDESIFNAISDFDLDINGVRDCYDNGTYLAQLDSNKDFSSTVPVEGVPGFVIGKISDEGVVEGFLIPGAYPYETFDEVLTYLED